MSAAKDSLSIEKGATFNKTWLYQDSAGTAIDISSYEGRMQIRQKVDSTTTEVSLTSNPAAGIDIEPSSVVGRVDITIGADTTDTLTFTSGVYDLELYNPIDVTDVIRLVEGSVLVIPNVTR